MICSRCRDAPLNHPVDPGWWDFPLVLSFFFCNLPPLLHDIAQLLRAVTTLKLSHTMPSVNPVGVADVSDDDFQNGSISSGSESDYLDSSSARKRRRTSPAPVVDDEDDELSLIHI